MFGGLSDPKVCRGRMHRVTIKPQPSLHSQKYALQDPGQACIMRKKQREHRLRLWCRNKNGIRLFLHFPVFNFISANKIRECIKKTYLLETWYKRRYSELMFGHWHNESNGKADYVMNAQNIATERQHWRLSSQHRETTAIRALKKICHQEVLKEESTPKTCYLCQPTFLKTESWKCSCFKRFSTKQKKHFCFNLILCN